MSARRALALMEFALALMELPLPPLQIRRRHRELAMRWHPDRNDSGRRTHK
jgi:hypothetical protein